MYYIVTLAVCTLENMHKQEISGIKYFNVKLVIPFKVILI
jgi:hypothetical protein